MSDLEKEQGQFEQDENNQQDSQSQFIKTTKAGRKNLCDVCVNSLAKYTCPGCEIKSCSLNCINKHKKNTSCSGKSNPTQYIEKGQINEQCVRKDFQFVKSMLQQTDKVKKTLTGVTTQIQEPKRFYFLRKHAKAQYNIKVHQGPAMIQRHRENISFFYMKTKTIYWVIQILYYRGNKKYTRHILQPQADNKTIQQILPNQFLCQELLLKDINTRRPEEFDVFIQNREMSSPYEQIQHQQKKEKPSETKRIIEVQKSLKLYEALINLNVYEFPTLILVHKSLKKSFNKWKKIN